ncbi:50S ribosomal protein L6 [Candidatus Dependentiae bacterium]|nr:50S ribosomal protein L6 [Candidatus Dependentiae bacterium]
MSKIGRKSINTGSVQIEIKGQKIYYKGPKDSGVHELPSILIAKLEGEKLIIETQKTNMRQREVNRLWGLNRALLANKIFGAGSEFQKQIEIVGLGYKAALSGKKVTFSLGYSHKIDFDLPEGISLTIDKTGKMLMFSSSSKELIGHVCSMVRSLRPPEPYKGTGVKLTTEVIACKAGKAKAAS